MTAPANTPPTERELEEWSIWTPSSAAFTRLIAEVRRLRSREAELECCVTLANDRTESQRVAELEAELSDEALAYSSLLQHHGAADIEYRAQRDRLREVEKDAEKLVVALDEIDRLASMHRRGAIGEAQSIARAALARHREKT